MKTTSEIQKTIQELIEVDTSEWSDAKTAKHERAIQFNKTCLMYLEQNPREEFLKQEKKRLETKIEKIKEGFAYYKKMHLVSKYNGDESKCRADYNKETGLSAIKKHLDNISYLLDL